MNELYLSLFSSADQMLPLCVLTRVAQIVTAAHRDSILYSYLARADLLICLDRKPETRST